MRRQIIELRQKMRECGIDVYILTDSDPHLSEYTGAHYHGLEEFSGFTGGEGTLAVSADDKAEHSAALWTDGRYFTQAETELSGSGIDLMKLATAGTISLRDWIAKQMPEGGVVLGFDGRCMAYAKGKQLVEGLGPAAAALCTDRDLCGELWAERPERNVTAVWRLGEDYCGKPAADKIRELREEMHKVHADVHVVSTLDDIAWILNLRADDIPCTPVFAAYLILTDREACLFTDASHFKDSDRETAGEVFLYLRKLGIRVYEYDAFYEILPVLCAGKKVLLDPKKCNYETVRLVQKAGDIREGMNPSTRMRVIKNETEIRNLRIAQHKDSVALTRFMYWFKNQRIPSGAEEESNENALTEWSCVEKLHEFRAMQEHFIEESFSTISAYGPNAAMAHYAPDPKRDVPIRARGLYLVDSGGQYLEGTTDVTRTWSCGPISREEREGVTLAVMANLRLADAVFLEGTSGLVLDGIVREPFWRRGLNFNHGTGHGVSFLLGVHEPPVGIRYMAASLESAYPLKEGMYLSDEPGLYEAGKFGVRIENLLLVQPDHTNDYGRFMRFETMNFCPIDKTCLDFSMMEERDIELLNAYHAKVFKELADDLPEEEAQWLAMMCEPAVRE